MDIIKKHGNWALITGASKGVGAAFATRLAQLGMNLLLVARSGDLLEKNAAILRKEYGVSVIAITADLGKAEGVDAVFCASQDYDVGLLVSNAGTGKIRYFLEGTPTEDAELSYMNAIAHQRLAQHFGAGMAQRGKGGVIFVSSTACFQPVPLMATYSACKIFVNHLAEALYHEWKPLGIDVAVVVLGPTETDGFYNLKTEQGVDLTAMPMQLMQPAQVVDIALRALGKKPLVTAGLPNKVFAFLSSRVLSRKHAARLWENIMTRSLAAGESQKRANSAHPPRSQ